MFANRLAVAIAWGVVSSACANPPSKEAPPEAATDPYLVSAIAVINRDGMINEFLLEPNSPHFRC